MMVDSKRDTCYNFGVFRHIVSGWSLRGECRSAAHLRRLASFDGRQFKSPRTWGLLLVYGITLSKKIFNVKTGHILICDFERGFVPPEMVKCRPVVVISKSSTHHRRLCTVIPLSTTEPWPIEHWHVPLSHDPLPHMSKGRVVWAKCDMIYTVSFERLDRPHRKTGGKRDYLSVKVSAYDLAAIFNGVRSYLPSER